MRQFLSLAAIVLAGLAIAAPAAGRVQEETANSFVTRQAVVVPASPEQAWDMLVRPSQWWSEVHSFSGDAANLSLHPRAGGCFCELLPGKDAASAVPGGSAEHMRVVYAEDARALRMVGALGPMQSEAVIGVLTIFLRPSDAGTQILWEYAVSGSLRKKGMAASVDTMLTEQIGRLAEKLGAGKVSGWRMGEMDDAGEVQPDAGGEPEDEAPSATGPAGGEQAPPPIHGR